MSDSADYEDNKLIAARREKLSQWRNGGDAFPNDFRRDVLAEEIHGLYAQRSAESLETAEVRISLGGRIMSRRVMGKSSFAHIQDQTGQLQLFVNRGNVGEALYKEFKSWDIGDIVGATGTLFRTRTGELSLRVETIRLLTKSLRPLPEKWHGLSDRETRYRQRYVDLIMNPDTRRVFDVRARLIRELRKCLDTLGFREVETPMLQPIPGGATARPFVTHYHALEHDYYLRIAPELYLKRLVVGGFERVYEINRNFRNEGLSTRHNPEFTMLEFYQAYADHADLMELTETLLRNLAEMVIESSHFHYQGHELDLSRPFARYTLKEALSVFNTNLDAGRLDEPDYLHESLEGARVAAQPEWGIGKMQMELFEATVETELIQPTFITAYPAEVSPLARRSQEDPEVTDRFELFIAGREIANGFSELNDPEDQAERFRAQASAKEAGDQEAMYYDSDYIRALEYGMPPAAGEGIGIDRLVMLFTDSASIRDVLLFPQLRPESSEVTPD